MGGRSSDYGMKILDIDTVSLDPASLAADLQFGRPHDQHPMPRCSRKGCISFINGTAVRLT